MSDTVLKGLMVFEIIVSIGIVVLVLLQNRGDGLGSMFGGSGGGEVYRTKRGLEKTLYRLTIVLSVVLCAISLVIVKYS